MTNIEAVRMIDEIFHSLDAWVHDEGWCFFDEDIDVESDSDLIKVDSWCDLKPYRREE